MVKKKSILLFLKKQRCQEWWCLDFIHEGKTMRNKEFEEAQNFNIYYSPVPNCGGGSNSRDELVIFM